MINSQVICGIPVALVACSRIWEQRSPFFHTRYRIADSRIKPMTLVTMLICFVLASSSRVAILGQHQKDRITNFIHPEQDLKGSGYQVNQSKIAIGSVERWERHLQRKPESIGISSHAPYRFHSGGRGERWGLWVSPSLWDCWGFNLFRTLNTAQTARDETWALHVMGVFGITFSHD
jgi:rod shape determining protein RodA